ncbi:hypothetical protein GO730_04270 [Spirosoma sp. HMF3257]|uniref:Uncharacterized protein n=1 Tax=Spirosoma telluris TaxID=2183553 RepID=A0A327NHM6_9BACT|nr:hypothetical protein [Spirosoma telluris]RAI73809.1 hypothetical protein HMF3257_04240 [Spirosoma telluris]
MKDSLQPFNKLLEGYLFSVASQFIDQFDDENQTNLIKLISTIETDSTCDESVEPDRFSLPTQQLEKQWKSILTPPRKHKKVSKKNTDTFLLEVTQRRIKHYQDIIDQISLTIHKLEVARQNFTNRNCGDLQRAKLNMSYELALQRNKDYLALVIGQKMLVSKRLTQLLHSV